MATDADASADGEGLDVVAFDAETYDVDILYADRMLPDVGALDAGADAADAAPEAATGLQPCTSAGQTGCVACSDSTGGLCSPTEALFVAHDIALGLVLEAGTDPPPSYTDDAGVFHQIKTCYACLANHSCIDNVTLGVSTKECEDVPDSGNFPLMNGVTTTPAECEAVVDCILASGKTAAGDAGVPSCATPASGGPNNCYCGTDPAAQCASGSFAAPITTGVNGACAQQIANGFGAQTNGFPLGDGTDIEQNLTTVSFAAGRADQIFVCASAGKCTSCF
jgi:hypothetical protein